MSDPFEATIALWPQDARHTFGTIRSLILNAAAQAEAGPLTESLKWGQPAWRPTRRNQGSTLRLMWQPNPAGPLVMYVDCKTTLSRTMQEIYPSEFMYESNRGLRILLDRPLPEHAIDHLARLTFTYHGKR